MISTRSAPAQHRAREFVCEANSSSCSNVTRRPAPRASRQLANSSVETPEPHSTMRLGARRSISVTTASAKSASTAHSFAGAGREPSNGRRLMNARVCALSFSERTPTATSTTSPPNIAPASTAAATVASQLSRATHASVAAATAPTVPAITAANSQKRREQRRTRRKSAMPRILLRTGYSPRLVGPERVHSEKVADGS